MGNLLNGRQSSRSLEYTQLRELYDKAFREWVEESRSAAMQDDSGEQPQPEASVRLLAAQAVLYERREALARFLMTADPETIAHSHIQDAAYFIWLNAGQPGGTSSSDWYSAQDQLGGVQDHTCATVS